MTRASTIAIIGCLLAASVASCDKEISQKQAEPAPNVITLTEDDNRTNLVLGVGDTFQVKLESIPTAGYTWHVTHLPNGMEEIGEEDWAPTEPEIQSQPGFTGGSHYIIKTFRTTAPGDHDLVLLEGRVWELFEEGGAMKPDWKSHVENRFQIYIRVRE